MIEHYTASLDQMLKYTQLQENIEAHQGPNALEHSARTTCTISKHPKVSVEEKHGQNK